MSHSKLLSTPHSSRNSLEYIHWRTSTFFNKLPRILEPVLKTQCSHSHAEIPTHGWKHHSECRMHPNGARIYTYLSERRRIKWVVSSDSPFVQLRRVAPELLLDIALHLIQGVGLGNNASLPILKPLATERGAQPPDTAIPPGVPRAPQDAPGRGTWHAGVASESSRRRSVGEAASRGRTHRDRALRECGEGERGRQLLVW